MMKPLIECLRDEEVGRLLTGEVDAARTSELEQHLANCIDCRQRLEQQVGDDCWWNETESSLRSQQVACHVAASLRDAEDVEPDAASLGETRLRESILDLLGPTDDPNMLGRIGPYEIIGLLGQGGMGAVFKGFDRSLNRFVAIKMLLPHLAASGAARKRFAREGQAVAAVVDDHVMAIHCVDEWQGVPYLVMTYSRGVSLQKRLSDNGPLEVREILRIGMQAAKGLAAAHAQGIVHRDIKPANIFLDQNVERVQLMDFGLARAVDDASLTRSGTLAGTPQYMSPEQARAETVDHRSDLFSLGSVMYAMCTGHAPFRAESSYSVLRLITDKEPRSIREVNPDVPDWLCAIIGKLMAKEASDRFASAKEVAKLLEDCLAHVQQPTIAALPDGLVDRSVPRAFSFRSRTIGVFAMFAVVCSIIVAMLLMQMPDKPNQDGAGDADGVQVAANNQTDASDAGIMKLTELLEMQKLREKSLRQLSLVGNIRQTQQIETKRIEGESNEDYIKRYTSPKRIFDGPGPFPMLIERDYNADSGHIKYGDLNGKLPLLFREWFFKQDVFMQPMGVEDGHGQATITKKPVDELRQPWSGWIRADVYAFRPILDHELSSVLEKAAYTPSGPDPGGRPLFHLDKLKSVDQKVQWIATFLHQEPSEINGRTAVEHLWYRVFWEQIDKELLITRVDELSVVGDANSMPLRVALVDDYRYIDGVSVPHRVRTYMFANPSGLVGAEFVASEVRVNGGVGMPTQLQIPAGTSVTDELTGKRYRQPVDEPKSTQDSPKATIGSSESTTINPDIPAEGKPIDKDKLLNELRERDRKFSRRTVELERTWDTLTSPRGMASQNRFHSMKLGQADPGIPEGLPEDYQQPHRIRYIWTGQNFESTLEILVDLETAIHPEHGKLESRSIESDCFSYYRYWNRDLEIFSHSSDIARLSGGKKAWEYLLPSGFGFTHSILSVSNAVEVEDGYVLKGLISLPSATIGNRKNCFEIHVDKELILRKAVIQYHVYDFVIVTTGRSEFDGMPPLAKHAAVSIHNIGQDEKRSGDVGNYKYELIALSEELSKAEYDLRVNFAIPKGTKLSAGLNLVDVNLQGLPGVTQVERDAPAPRPEVTPRDSREIENDQAANQSSRTFTPSDLTAKGDYLVENQKSIRVRFLVKSAKRQTKLLREPWILSTKKDEGDSNQTKEILVVVSPEAEEAFKTTGVDDLRAHLLNKEIEVKGLLTKGGGLQIFGHGAINQHYFININTIEQIRVIEANPAGIDHGNARSVVEAYVAAARAGDIAKAAALAKNGHVTADPKRIAEIPDFLNVQRLKIQTVYVNDPANPKKALATSAAVKLEEEYKQPNGQRDGFMVFTLELTDDKWFVIDIDFESEAGAEKELKRFLEANPNSIGMPPQTSREVVVQNANVSAPPAGDTAKAAPAESPLLVEARKALQACQESLSWKQKFDMRVTNSYVHSQMGKVTIESRVRRDAPCMVESSLQTFDDQPKDHIQLDNWRLDDGEMFIGRTTTVGQKKLTGLMTIKGRQKASWRMFESSSSFAMEGHFPGNQGRTLMEILMESKEPDVRMEKIGDHDCLRISDRNDWGTMIVWIDAGPSRRLRQWESSKERGNRFADGRVGEDKDTANLESFSYFVEDIQYQVLDGIEIAVSCRLRSTSIPNGGTKQETSSEYRRTEIHLRPDFASNNPFVHDFDNGARINDGDAFDRDAAFRWQDGKLTPLPNTKPSIVAEDKRPSDATVPLKSTNTNSVVGHWKIAKLADMPASELAGATVVIDKDTVKMHVPSQKGPHPHWRYALVTEGEIDLCEIDDAKGETTSRAKYSLEEKFLYLALNAKKGDYPRPESATGEVPQAGVQYIVLEMDELENSTGTAVAPDGGDERHDGKQQVPAQPLGKT